MPFPSLSGLRPETTPATPVTASTTIHLDKFGTLDTTRTSTSAFALLQAAWSRILAEFTEDEGVITFGRVLDPIAGAPQPIASMTLPFVDRIHVLPWSKGGKSRSNSEIVEDLGSGGRTPCNRSEEKCTTCQDDSTIETIIVFPEQDETSSGASMYKDALFGNQSPVLILTATLSPRSTLDLQASCNGAFFDPTAVECILRAVADVTCWIAQNPAQSFVDAMACVREECLSVFPQAISTDLTERGMLLHSRFEDFAASQPSATALVFVQDIDRNSPSNITWTYGDLNERASTVAQTLLSLPTISDAPVIPIISDRCPELYAVILGVLKAGKAWCPIDTLSPPSRRYELISRTMSPILVVTREPSKEDRRGIPEAITMVNFANLEEMLDQRTDLESTHRSSSGGLAYLIWTSGTTGPPKGVPVSHRAASTSMKSLQQVIPQGNRRPLRCLQFSQYTFDVFVQDLFYTWGLGGAILSATQETMVGSFPQLATVFEATHAHLTPAFGARVPRRSCPTMQVVTMIGEALPQHVANDWGQGTKAFNTYGPAEAAVVSTVAEFGGSDSRTKSTVIGRPLPTLGCYVLRHGRPTLKGCVGQLGLAGPQLADGYFRDPEKTAARFVDYSWASERIYMTGDLVRHLPNDTLDFVGREDDLVKVNGIRIELSEISFALSGCHSLVDQIETCYMIRRERPSRRIVCFLTAERMQHEDAGNALIECGPQAVGVAQAAMLRSQEALPDYMNPQTFLVIRSMPRTSSAKIDRKILQAAYEELPIEEWETAIKGKQAGSGIRNVAQAESYPVFRILSSISEMPTHQIQATTSLASLGIDSLASMMLASRMRESGYNVNPRAILSCRTAGDLAFAVRHIDSEVPQNGLPSFDLTKFHDLWHPVLAVQLTKSSFFVAPATSLQESLLAETFADPQAYWSNHVLEILVETDVSRLHKAWCLVTQHTEALRTAFLATGSLSGSLPSHDPTFLQLIFEESCIDWAVHPIATENEFGKVATELASRITSQHAETHFQDPPWAVRLLQSPQKFVMMLTIHHCLHDQDSIDLIFGSVQSFYEKGEFQATCTHQLRDVLPFLLRPSEHNDQAESSYWQERLSPFKGSEDVSWPDLTSLRDSNKESDLQALKSHFCALSTPKELLCKRARELSISPVALVRAAWGFLVASYLGVAKCVLGEVRSDRLQLSGFKDVVAPMVSVVPVLIHMSNSFDGFIDAHSEWAHSAMSRPSPTPSAIRKMLDRPRHLPLYESVFTFFNQRRERHRDMVIGPWRIIEDPVGLFTEHPTAFNVYDEGDHYSMEVFAQMSLIAEDQLRLFAVQMDSLLRAIVTGRHSLVSHLRNSLSPAAISYTHSAISKPRNHGSLTRSTYWIEHLALCQPDWPAVEIASSVNGIGGSSELWTFEELWNQSEKIGSYLRLLHLHGNVIAMCVGRNLKSYAAILGILRSGNVYLPIDETLPSERKDLLLRDSGCCCLVTDEPSWLSFGEVPSKCQVLNLDSTDVKETLSSLTSPTALDNVDPDANAYMLYTSGSTGKPKGVLVSHRNLCNFVEGLGSSIEHWHAPAGACRGSGKFLGLASRAFDVHLCEMFLGWRLGLSCVTAPRDLLLNDLKASVTRLGVTHACFVPSLLDQSGLRPQDVPNLVYFSVGGEKITSKTLETWSCQKDTLVVNAYGPTELAIGCCASRIHSACNARNIGGPYGNTEAHVLIPQTCDYALRGQAGELCFTGDLVGNGYFQRPDALGFVDSFHGMRMYRTGDIARMMADGTLEYLGRGDDQAKIRGQRIELGEVTETIRASQLNPLDATTLLIKRDDVLRSQLISFVSLSQKPSFRYGAELKLQKERMEWALEIYETCKAHLPTYMVPDMILPISVIPLVQISGKADTKRLEEFFCNIPLQDLISSKKPRPTCSRDSQPLNKMEEGVQSAICDSISTNSHSLHPETSIFELGFDSLSVIGLAARLRRLGFLCDVPTLLSQPSIRQIGALPRLDAESDDMSSRNSKDDAPLRLVEVGFMEQLGINNLSSDRIEIVRPCLPLQESMLAKSANSTDSKPYINHIVLKLEERVDEGQLCSAVGILIARTPILRTSFALLNDRIVQLVHAPESPLCCRTEVWSPRDEQEEQHNEERLSKVSSQMLKDLWKRPPFHAIISRSIGKESSRLHLLLHHALYDGVSLQMLLEDLQLCYAQGRPAPRASLDNLINFLIRQDKAAQEAFWTQYLLGFETGFLPTMPDEKHSVSQIETHLSLELSEIRRLSSKLKTTPSILFQFVVAMMLARQFSTNDFVLGVVLSGRTVPVEEVESIAGPCICTVPVRLRLPAAKRPFEEMLASFHEWTSKCLEHQFTSLRDIHRWLGVEQQLFNCLFSYTVAPEKPKAKGYWKELSSSVVPDYPLAVEIEPSNADDVIKVCVVFSESPNFCRAAKLLVENVELLLASLLRDEQVSVGANAEAGMVGERHTASRDCYDEDIWASEETRIKETISQLFSIDGALITKNVSFFRLGLDSVSVIPLSQHLRRVGLPILSSDLMRHASIGMLWNHLSTKSESLSTARHVPETGTMLQQQNGGGQAEKSREYPCTPLQAGMIFATLSSSGDTYVHHHVLQLQGDVNVARLKKAWTDMVACYDILRTSFHLETQSAPSWKALVRSSDSLKWEQREKCVNLDSFIRRLRRRLRYVSANAFEEPLVHANLVRDEAGTYLIISMHHALYDGISLRLLFQNLASAYHGRDWPESPSFLDVAHKVFEGQSKAVKFWSDNLKDYSAGAEVQLHTSKNLTESQESIAQVAAESLLRKTQALDVTLQAVVLLAYAKVLSTIYKRRDVVFGWVVSGRNLPLPGIENVIGPVFNTVPFRVQFGDPTQSNRHAVKEVQTFVAQCQEHQAASLRSIQDAWRKTTKGPQSRLFSSLLLFQKFEDHSEWVKEPWSIKQTDGPLPEYPLNFEVEQEPGAFTVKATSNSELPSGTSLRGLVRQFKACLLDIVNSPQQSALAFPSELGSLPLGPPKRSSVGSESTSGDDSHPAYPVLRNMIASYCKIDVASIEPSTNIYQLGIDSISAIELASRGRNRGLPISVANILQGETLQGVLKLSRASEATTDSITAVVHTIPDSQISLPSWISESDIEEIIPCLSGQVYHLALDRPASQTRPMPLFAFKVRTHLNVERLEVAWARLCVRNAILRTTFVVDPSSKAYQIVLKAPTQSSRLRVARYYDQSFDLCLERFSSVSGDPATPLCRFGLLGNKLDGVTLLLRLHHALYDAESLPSLIFELVNIYQGLDLSEVTNFSAHVQKTIQGLGQIDQELFWKKELRESEISLIGRRDFPQPMRIAAKAPLFVSIKGLEKKVASLQRLCQDSQISLPIIFLLAFSRLVARLTGASNPTFGYYHTGRSAPGASDVPGPLLNILPFVVPNAMQASIRRKALRIRRDLARRIQYEQSYLGQVIDWMGLTNGPAFNMYLNILWHPSETHAPLNRDFLQPQAIDPAFGLDNAVGSPLNIGIDALKWPVSSQGIWVDVALDADNDGVQIAAKCVGGLVDHKSLQGHLQHLGRETEAMVECLQQEQLEMP